MLRELARILREGDGQDLIEYALLAALISLVSVTAITALGSAIIQHYQSSTTTFVGS